MGRKVFEFVSIYLFMSVLLGLITLLQGFPIHPITPIGWSVWYVAAVPLTVAGEAIGSAVFNRKIAKAIDADTEHISFRRIGYGVFVTLIFMALVLFVAALLNAVGGDFWDTNFSMDW